MECITRNINRCYDISPLRPVSSRLLYEEGRTYHKIAVSYIDDRELLELICGFRLDHFRQFLPFQPQQEKQVMIHGPRLKCIDKLA